MTHEYKTDHLREFLARCSTKQVTDYAARLGIGERTSRAALENAICYAERMRVEGRMAHVH